VTVINEEPTEAAPPKKRRRRTWLAVAVAAALVLVAFFGITGATGLTGPQWLHRYQYSELGDLAAAINADAGDLRTPDDCWRTSPSTDGAKRDPNGPLREIARTDYVRSRVVVRGYASQAGKIDSTTNRAITDHLNALFASRPEFSWAMVDLEPSPDGWSPLVSCRLVTHGWITGF
jgi:hypothetical protein